jgi:hypothetical protein
LAYSSSIDFLANRHLEAPGRTLGQPSRVRSVRIGTQQLLKCEGMTNYGLSITGMPYSVALTPRHYFPKALQFEPVLSKLFQRATAHILIIEFSLNPYPFSFKEAMMLDFILELERMLKIWPDGVKWSLVQIAEQTQTKVPLVVEYLTEVLSKNPDVHDPLSYNEVSKAFLVLRERNKAQLEAHHERERKAIQGAIEAYEQVMDKVRLMEIAKNRRSAYRTLNYTYGNYINLLPSEIKTQICDDCLRIGIKEGINFQELSQWLQRGIQHLMDSPSRDSVEDALDFLEAYGDYFLTEANGKGEKFLTNLLLRLKPAAMEFDLSPKLNEVAGDFKLTEVMDVFV